MRNQTVNRVSQLYPVYAGNVRIGTVLATSSEQATRNAQQTFGKRDLRILPPYQDSQSWAWDVPCPTV